MKIQPLFSWARKMFSVKKKTKNKKTVLCCKINKWNSKIQSLLFQSIYIWMSIYVCFVKHYTLWFFSNWEDNSSMIFQVSDTGLKTFKASVIFVSTVVILAIFKSWVKPLMHHFFFCTLAHYFHCLMCNSW